LLPILIGPGPCTRQGSNAVPVDSGSLSHKQEEVDPERAGIGFVSIVLISDPTSAAQSAPFSPWIEHSWFQTCLCV